MVQKQSLISILLIFTALGFSLAQDSTAKALNEFEEFTSDSIITTISTPTIIQHQTTGGAKQNNIFWILSVLSLTAIAGVLVRFKQTRQLRSLFLIFSIVVLGFYRGACPCSIQSLQHAVLLFRGGAVKWQSVLLFAGLIPLAYLFGRVYCGWICHLGALQEIIFTTSSFKFFQTEAAQKVMRVTRIVALVALVTQLMITGTNLYKRIDPFVAVYNFYSANAIGWILAALVIISSFLMYRPFCKTICPVGLVLGWISKVPGASVLGVTENCITCVKCSKACKIKAITHDMRASILDNQECIRCGECLKECVKDSLLFSRNSADRRSKVECRPSKGANA